jgi:hypothetical protein
MGSCFSFSASRRDEEKAEGKKSYSWDNRERIDPSRYTVADIERATSGRMPGEVSGQQLIIRNCKG